MLVSYRETDIDLAYNTRIVSYIIHILRVFHGKSTHHSGYPEVGGGGGALCAPVFFIYFFIKNLSPRPTCKFLNFGIFYHAKIKILKI